MCVVGCNHDVDCATLVFMSRVKSRLLLSIWRPCLVLPFFVLAACASHPVTDVDGATTATQASDPHGARPQILIVNFGESTSTPSGTSVRVPTTTTGVINDSTDFRFVRNQVFDIPARLRAAMAVEYFVVGGPTGKTVTLEMRTIHPPLTNPATGETTRVSRWFTAVPKNFKQWRAYTFEYDWEVVPGEWTFEFWYDGQFVTQQVFNVVPVDP